MSIVLDEYEWAENMINRRSLGSKPSETLLRVSKYYSENKYSKKEIRDMLDTFVLQCDPKASLQRWSECLDRSVKNASKSSIIRLDGIDISKKEMECISKLNGKQIKRLAFALLCMAKYCHMINPNNNYWVNVPDREIMKMANISTSVKRQSLMFAELRQLEMIKFSKKVDNLNVQVLFVDEGENAIHITDLRNLGYQYLKYYGEPYFECVNCGITEKIVNPSSGRKQKYCPSCAIEIHTRQKVDSVMRQRNSSICKTC